MSRPSRYTPQSQTIRYRKPVRGSVVFWLRFFGVVAFIIVLLRLPGAQEVQFSHIDLRWLGFCMLLTLFHLLLDAFAWQWLLSAQKIAHSYPKTLLVSLASHYLGLVTPGRSGEFLAAGYISAETGITFGYALSSVVMKKIIYWVVVMAWGLWALQLLADVPLLKSVQWVMIGSLVVLTVLSAGIGLWVVSLRRLTRKWERLSPWQIEMTEFWSGVRHLLSWRLLEVLALSIVAFGMVLLQLYAVIQALGLNLGWALVIKIAAFSQLVARLIPLSVIGFGSKDAAVIGLLAQQGFAPTVGLSVTLLLLMCSYVVTLLISGLCWWIKPLVVRQLVRSHKST